MMKKLLLFAAAFVFVAVGSRSAPCRRDLEGDHQRFDVRRLKHSADKHGDKAADHRACVEKCIGDGRCLHLHRQRTSR